jgi:hypothetical protein
MGADIHQSLELQALERLPDRRAADCELARDPVFHDLLARQQATGDDQLLEVVIDMVGE